VKRALALSVALAAAACSPAAPPLSGAGQILKQCKSFLGKQVRATGFLGECAGYDCHLYPNKVAWIANRDAWNAVRAAGAKLKAGAGQNDGKRDEAWDRLEALWPIGIGWDEAFDRKAAPLQYHYVVISGRMDDENCDGRGGLDRSPGIHPTDIRAWTPSEGAPPNTQ
jgi:hypothetical protein